MEVSRLVSVDVKCVTKVTVRQTIQILSYQYQVYRFEEPDQM